MTVNGHMLRPVVPLFVIWWLGAGLAYGCAAEVGTNPGSMKADEPAAAGLAHSGGAVNDEFNAAGSPSHSVGPDQVQSPSLSVGGAGGSLLLEPPRGPEPDSGPAPDGVSQLISVGLDGAVYFRFQPPADNYAAARFESPPLFHEGLERRVLLQRLPRRSWSGTLFALSPTGARSNGTPLTLDSAAEIYSTLDVDSNCDTYGQRLGTRVHSQSFQRGREGEDVLVGLSFELTKRGSPNVPLVASLWHEETDRVLWTVEIPPERVESGIQWISLTASGGPAGDVPYVLVDEGESYRFGLSVPQATDGPLDYYVWRSSGSRAPEEDCLPGGESSAAADKDFHLRTAHATSALE